MKIEGGTSPSHGAYDVPGATQAAPAGAAAAEQRASQNARRVVPAAPGEGGPDASPAGRGYAATLAAWAVTRHHASERPGSQEMARFRGLVDRIHSDLRSLGALDPQQPNRPAAPGEGHVDVEV